MLGLSDSARRMAGSGRRLAELALAMAKDRLELLSLELAEEKTRLVQLLVTACLAVFFLIMGAGAATAAVVFFLPPAWRGPALAAFAVLYLLLGLWAILAIKRSLSTRRIPFADTLAELEKDKECFSTLNSKK